MTLWGRQKVEAAIRCRFNEWKFVFAVVACATRQNLRAIVQDELKSRGPHPRATPKFAIHRVN
jgi:hypothetical protein